MKIKHLKIHGFRGFREEREFLFDDRLTLISAPNSHGKTSISEALEWLIYGATSKVERADSKDEYKGSYRNVRTLVFVLRIRTQGFLPQRSPAGRPESFSDSSC